MSARQQTLDSAKSPVIYRIHPSPSFEKMQSLADFLQTLKIKFARNAQVKAKQLNEILAKVEGGDLNDLVNETILRSQSQAVYSTKNEGHFGLNLKQYAHFTSPIRRYADLIVHRALILAMGFGKDGLEGKQVERLTNIASDISDLERRAMAAERETTDRLIAYHLADNIGATFQGRISGVTRSGLFVRLQDTGCRWISFPFQRLVANISITMSNGNRLIGENSGETHRMGATVSVRLVEAVPTAGALRFELLSKGQAKQTVRMARIASVLGADAAGAARTPGRGRSAHKGKRKARKPR